MACSPLVVSDSCNIYVCRNNQVFSSDIQTPVLGSVPFTVQKFLPLCHQYYFLDSQGQLWKQGNLYASGVSDVNQHYVLFQDGRVASLNGNFHTLPFRVTRLVNDLLLDGYGNLYDGRGGFLAAQVADAQTDGNEIIIQHLGPERVLEYIGDNTEKDKYYRELLHCRYARKAVVNQGTLLLLTADGILVAVGANENCECGIETAPVTTPQRLYFPAPVVDFDFHQSMGWALLSTGQLYVWGYNHEEFPFFLQWSREQYISPRELVL